ncbi:hypothetical protein J4Q44_G00128920 [Coregonus suidteri]|uniref:Uncharacterized protein n=1 Tax=Coregonus suidteri TaxID=861788 RepID=A0AAN8LY24_9TELE
MFHEAIRRLLLTERSQAGSPATKELDWRAAGFTSSKHSRTVGPLSKALNPTTCSPSRGTAPQPEPVLVSTVCVRSAVWGVENRAEDTFMLFTVTNGQSVLYCIVLYCIVL